MQITQLKRPPSATKLNAQPNPAISQPNRSNRVNSIDSTSTSLNQLLPLREFDFSNNNDTSKLLSLRYSPCDNYVAVGSQDGNIRVIQDKNFNVIYTLYDQKQTPSPVQCVRWKPSQKQNVNETKNFLLSVYANGTILYWHITSNQVLGRHENQSNPLNCCEFHPSGEKFVTAGQDTKIRLFDLNKSLNKIQEMNGTITSPGHNNRIFALKFIDQNSFISSGWDSTLYLWDIRQQQATGHIFGPKVFGDSLDVSEDYILAGSWRDENQIEIYDSRTFKCVKKISWLNKKDDLYDEKHDQQLNFVYACCFDDNGKNILAGTSGTHYSEIRMYSSSDYTIKGQTEKIERGIFSISSAVNKKVIAYGCADGKLGMIRY